MRSFADLFRCSLRVNQGLVGRLVVYKDSRRPSQMAPEGSVMSPSPETSSRPVRGATLREDFVLRLGRGPRAGPWAFGPLCLSLAF